MGIMEALAGILRFLVHGYESAVGSKRLVFGKRKVPYLL
jgi:hypothetical protein